MHNNQIENKSTSEMLERLDFKTNIVRNMMKKTSSDNLAALWNQLDTSAIYHDCALEGQFISREELRAAFDPRHIADPAKVFTYALIRSHKKAFQFVRKMARQNDIIFDINLFKTLNIFFSTSDIKDKNNGFRNNIPLHRVYFHKIHPAESIPEDMNNLISWMSQKSESEKLHPMIWAAKFHFAFMHIFPYLNTSGKVGRSIVNIMLMRMGYLPAVVHATDRQRYYETLRTSQHKLTCLLIDSEMASLNSAIRFLKQMQPIL